MTLLERIAARECAFEECTEDHTASSLFCPNHLWMAWRNLLDRTERGTYIARRRFTARDETWTERAA